MRSSNKSRSRNKNNRRSNPTNVVNRVFDSSGPEGKVRGTPQQIIDKYQNLASDAMLSGDRINSENFLQHAEHYLRLLSEAQREINERREAQEVQRQQHNQNRQKPAPQEDIDENSEARQTLDRDAADLFPAEDHSVHLVETPENESGTAKPDIAQKSEGVDAALAEKTGPLSEPETVAK